MTLVLVDWNNSGQIFVNIGCSKEINNNFFGIYHMVTLYTRDDVLNWREKCLEDTTVFLFFPAKGFAWFVNFEGELKRIFLSVYAKMLNDYKDDIFWGHKAVIKATIESKGLVDPVKFVFSIGKDIMASVLKVERHKKEFREVFLNMTGDVKFLESYFDLRGEYPIGDIDTDRHTLSFHALFAARRAGG